LSDDIQGLCHISEFGNEENMKSKIEAGKEYDFYIQSISAKDHRMSLGFGAPKEKAPAKEKESQQ